MATWGCAVCVHMYGYVCMGVGDSDLGSPPKLTQDPSYAPGSPRHLPACFLSHLFHVKNLVLHLPKGPQCLRLPQPRLFQLSLQVGHEVFCEAGVLLGEAESCVGPQAMAGGWAASMPAGFCPPPQSPSAGRGAQVWGIMGWTP